MSDSMTFSLTAPQSRPGSRFGRLPYYNASLTETSDHKSPDFPVGLTRHHVIPWNMLRSFWNTLIEQGHSSVLFGNNRLVSRVAENIDSYIIEEWQPIGRTAAQRCLRNLGRMTHNPRSLIADGWQDFMELYAWLPGNLFIGPIPELRLDDPGERFESRAERAVNPKFNRLLIANNFIESYTHSPTESLALEASKALSRIAEILEVHAFRGARRLAANQIQHRRSGKTDLPISVDPLTNPLRLERASHAHAHHSRPSHGDISHLPPPELVACARLHAYDLTAPPAPRCSSL